jgi:membrane-bound serine protease (ClpP class)
VGAFIGAAGALEESGVHAEQAGAGSPVVEKLVLKDTIQPVSAGELKRAIDKAQANRAQALLVVLDTPGGLLDSMRSMCGAILSSQVPVIVYVGPSGARAGSAGFYLLESADVAAMAPGTNAGAAHVVSEFGKVDDTMMQKIENDSEAFLRSYVTKRGRNAEAASAAAASSHSYTAEEALDQHLIDLIEPSEGQLLAALDGRTVTRMDGAKTTLHTSGARVVEVKPTLREELLGWLVDPDIGFWAGTFADPVYSGVAPGGGAGTDGAGGEVWRARGSGGSGDCLPDVWNADAGGCAGTRTGDQPGGGNWGKPGIWHDHGGSGAAGV